MSIYKKLLDFQKLGVSIKKSSTNPHFKNKYADINEVLDKVKEPLNKLSVVILQTPGCDNHNGEYRAGLWTYLIDTEDDTRTEGFLPFIGATDPQKLGSNLTYLRRYSLVAMLGLEDDDDDGQAASTPALKAATKPAMTTEYANARLSEAKTVEELVATFKGFPVAIQKDPEVIAMAGQIKNQIS